MLQRFHSLFNNPKTGFLIFIGSLLLTANLLSITAVGLWGLAGVIWLAVLYFFGRTVLGLVADETKFTLPERVVFTVGLAVVGLYVIGLLLNMLGIAAGIRLLQLEYILPVFDAVMIGLLFFGYKKSRLPDFCASRISKSGLLTLAPAILPLVSLLGATQLNNEGPAFFATLNLCLTVGFTLAAIFIKKLHYEKYLLSLLFSVSLSLVLSVSMRSNHLIGFDIFGEYREFTQTLNAGMWTFGASQSTYGGCLSITLLPTLLAQLIPIPAEYIFKFVLQAILCVLPLIVYAVARRAYSLNKLHAFVAGLFFIAPGQFIFQFPALIRQQVALVLFGLLFLVAVNYALPRKTQFFLVTAFSIAMIMSHYSTTYVCLAFLLLYWLLAFVTNKISRSEKSLPHVSLSFIAILFLSAFLWYGQMLQNTGGITEKISTSFANIKQISDAESRSPIVNYILGNYNSVTQDQLHEIAETRATSHAISNNDEVELYVMSPDGPSPQSSVGSVAYDLIHRYIPLFANAFVLLGVLAATIAFVMSRQNTWQFSVGVTSMLLIALMIALPNISNDYNLERLYQQLLILIAPAFVVGVAVVVRKREYISGCLALLVLICASGFADYTLFGKSNINLNNLGANYDHYYTTGGEYASVRWLEKNSDGSKINFDNYGRLRAMAYTGINSNRYIVGIMPTEVGKGNYVYATKSNLQRHMTYSLYQQKVFTHNFHQHVISQNKDTVYSSGGSAIYK